MHIRCPHCHNPVEVVGDDYSDLTCPSCGSHFNLISGDATTAYSSKGGAAPARRSVGHFELIQQAGIGAFGSVWKARDTQLDRIVALKIPRNGQLAANEAEVFFREARAAAQLRHPQIVGVHEIGRDNETIYIVSDFIEGANLKEWLSSQRLSPREAAELVARIADGLQHAHESGVVHRDLKPGNIMLDLDGQPHITDFGLAKREQGEMTITVEGRVLGTPVYMPPEQAKGEGHRADRRSDVYSLGVILFELLTGEVPFRGEAQMVLVQIQRDEPPRPRKLNAKIPRDLETITLKCLEKEPAKRYQTATTLADDLRRWLRGVPIQARSIGRVARGWRWCKRQPVVAGLAAAVLLVLVAGISVSTWFAVAASLSSREARESARRQNYDAIQVLRNAEQRAEAERQAKEETARALAQSARKEYVALRAGMARERADAEARQGRWANAASHFRQAADLIGDRLDSDLLPSLALAALAAGDQAGYARACARLWDRDHGSDNQRVLSEMATICSAGPDALADMRPLVDAFETNRRRRVDYDLVVRALASHYRAHQYERVIKLQQIAEMGYFVIYRTPSLASWAWLRVPQTLFVAMAYQQLGKVDEANKYLKLAQQVHYELTAHSKEADDDSTSGSVLDPSTWQCRVMLAQLRREAESLINGQTNDAQPEPKSERETR